MNCSYCGKMYDIEELAKIDDELICLTCNHEIYCKEEEEKEDKLDKLVENRIQDEDHFNKTTDEYYKPEDDR